VWPLYCCGGQCFVESYCGIDWCYRFMFWNGPMVFTCESYLNTKCRLFILVICRGLPSACLHRVRHRWRMALLHIAPIQLCQLFQLHYLWELCWQWPVWMVDWGCPLHQKGEVSSLFVTKLMFSFFCLSMHISFHTWKLFFF